MKLFALIPLLFCGLAHSQALPPIPASNFLCNASGSVAYPAACGTLPAALLTASNVPVYSGAFTLNDCVKVGIASPVTFADAGASCGGGGGSGTVNSGTSGQMAYYASTGTGVSGATLGAGLSLSGSTLATSYTIRVVSGTTDTILSTDCANGVQYTSASAIAVTLPQATGGFAACNVDIIASGAGTVTITPTTSTINGLSSLAVAASRNANITALSGNYIATGTALVSGGTGTVTSVAATVPSFLSVSGSPITSTGTLAISLSGTALPIANGGTGSTSGLPVANITGLATGMAAYLAANTTFTITPTGCTPSAHAGGAFGGTITLAAGPCTSIVVTMNGATGYTAAHGYDCSVDDQTAQNAGTWIPKWGQTASSTTTATIPIPAAAGATDVISFSCAPN